MSNNVSGVAGSGPPDPEVAADGPRRFLASGDESGTAPEDRPFRPDVEGLRAVAVLLVVLFHAGWSMLSGGYIGVDVFFVISGFVITGVLLRERAASGRTSILTFYGRRCRRIIPAAALVIVVSALLAYVVVDSVTGRRTATDGRWASIFLANFHFASTGTDYFAVQQPPSPLLNFWSLSVEEQFYVVYPTLFLLIAGIGSRFALRVRLTWALGAVIVASFVFSILDTNAHATSAYFSPLTRAWELALGALVAVATPWLLQVPARVAAGATWLGLGAILAAAVSFNGTTAYPGSLVAIPVVGAALIIAGGVQAPRLGCRVHTPAAPLCADGQAVVLALSVALADLDPRGRTLKPDESPATAEPPLACAVLRRVRRHLPPCREPDPPRPPPHAGPMGERRDGSGRSRRDALHPDYAGRVG